MTPLHIAAKMNNLNICRLLIEDQDVNINLQIILIVFFFNSVNLQLFWLHFKLYFFYQIFMCYQKFQNLLFFMIKYDFFFINKEIWNYFNETALHIAVINENIDIVKLLLSRDDIDINIKEIF